MTRSMDEELNAILKGTSRAFYLSLAVLPPAARAPLSLAYMLARAADTVADAPANEQFDRESALGQLRQAILSLSESEWTSPSELSPDIEKERKLLLAVPDLLRILQSRPDSEAVPIRNVVSTLIDGMIWDQVHFPTHGGVVSEGGLSDQELEQYTYLVAGCVGPFWSKICALSHPSLVHLGDPRIEEQAIEFGKGLQWVNILRDVPKDQSASRYYLPDLARGDFRERLSRHLRRALEALKNASTYPALFPVSAVRHRLAVFWLLALAYRTLERLLQDGGPRPDRRSKVPRWEVFLWLALGPLVVVSKSGLRYILNLLAARVEQALKAWEDSK